MSAARYHLLPVARQGQAPLPHGKRPAFGWPAFTVRRGAPALLQLVAKPAASQRLRLTVALTERENKKVEAVLPNSGRVLGCFDWQAPSFLQTGEIVLEGGPDLWEGEEFIEIRVVEGDDPMWFFGSSLGQKPPLTLLEPLLPHILEMRAEPEPLAEFYERIGSLASLQPFGPKEAAVLDGLMALSRLPGGGRSRAVLNHHLAQFFEPMGRLRYEDPRSTTVEDDFSALETLAPMATLAQIDSQHPALKKALDFFFSHQRRGDRTLLLSDSYAITPFLSALALARGGVEADGWALAAFSQLERRRTLLQNNEIWAMKTPDGRKHGQNRALVVAFYALAVARTLEDLPRRAEAVSWREEFEKLTEKIISAQRSDGLWNTFFPAPDEQALPFEDPDLGASAGLALALGEGVRVGLAPMDCYFAAARANEALRSHLSPDGFLVQKREGTGHLVTWAMGWYAALLASLA